MDKTVIVTVLKSGGNFTPDHVRWLDAQLPPQYDHYCLTDMEVEGVETIKLRYNWPGWWSKMELFNPSLEIIGDKKIFYLDLDTVIVGSIKNLIEEEHFTTLTDFYREKEYLPPMGSAVMVIPLTVKPLLWNTWMTNPEQHMKDCTTPQKHGDQGFLQSTGCPSKRWQDAYPGRVISYKKDVQRVGTHSRAEGDGYLPVEASIVCFHGTPRPWDSKEPWVPKEKAPPTLVSFYTSNWKYTEHAERLRKECDLYGIKHDIRELPTTGDWLSNTRLKAKFIYEMLRLHEEIIWLDVDSTIFSNPKLFKQPLKASFCLVKHTKLPRHWHVGMMGFRRSPYTEWFTSNWIKAVEELGKTDEVAFEATWNLGLDFGILNNPNLVKEIPIKYHALPTSGEYEEGSIIGMGLSLDETKLEMKRRDKDV